MKVYLNTLLVIIALGIFFPASAQFSSVGFGIKKDNSPLGEVSVTSGPLAVFGGEYQMRIGRGNMNFGASKSFEFEAYIRNLEPLSGFLNEINLDGQWANRGSDPRQLLTKFDIEVTTDYVKIIFTDLACRYSFKKAYYPGYKGLADVELKIYFDGRPDEFSVTVTKVVSGFRGVIEYSLTNLHKEIPPSIIGLIAKGKTKPGTAMSVSCDGSEAKCFTPPTKPPIAVVKGPFVNDQPREIVPVCIGKEVVFDGSESKDQDEDGSSIVKYDWVVIPPSGLSLPLGSGKVFSFKPETEGEYTVRLRVTDDEGDWNEKTITFKGVIPKPIFSDITYSYINSTIRSPDGKEIELPFGRGFIAVYIHFTSSTGHTSDLRDGGLIIWETLSPLSGMPYEFKNCNLVPKLKEKNWKPNDWSRLFSNDKEFSIPDSHGVDGKLGGDCYPTPPFTENVSYSLSQTFSFQLTKCPLYSQNIERIPHPPIHIRKGIERYAESAVPYLGEWWGFYVTLTSNGNVIKSVYHPLIPVDFQ